MHVCRSVYVQTSIRNFLPLFYIVINSKGVQAASQWEGYLMLYIQSICAWLLHHSAFPHRGLCLNESTQPNKWRIRNLLVSLLAKQVCLIDAPAIFLSSLKEPVVLNVSRPCRFCQWQMFCILGHKDWSAVSDMNWIILKSYLSVVCASLCLCVCVCASCFCVCVFVCVCVYVCVCTCWVYVYGLFAYSMEDQCICSSAVSVHLGHGDNFILLWGLVVNIKVWVACRCAWLCSLQGL